MRLRTWVIAGMILGAVVVSAAAEVATVRLKDGTVLKGTHIGKEEGRWVLESPAVGKVALKDEDILSIEYAATPTPSAVEPSLPPASSPSPEPEAPQVDRAGYERRVMNDPSSMAALMNMAQDPEITAMLSDPAFRKMVQNLDVAGLQKDPRFLKFLERNDVKEIAQRASDGPAAGGNT